MKCRAIILLVTLLLSSASASDRDSLESSRVNNGILALIMNASEVVGQKEPGEKVTILSWSPQVVGYVYVNDTMSRTRKRALEIQDKQCPFKNEKRRTDY